MKKSRNLKTILVLLGLALCLTMLNTNTSMAEGTDLLTVTGQIRTIQGTIVTFEKQGVFYPVAELYLPKWAKPGKKASLLYSRKGYSNYYYEMVKPGAKFKTLEEQTKALNEPR